MINMVAGGGGHQYQCRCVSAVKTKLRESSTNHRCTQITQPLSACCGFSGQPAPDSRPRSSTGRLAVYNVNHRSVITPRRREIDEFAGVDRNCNIARECIARAYPHLATARTIIINI